MTIAFARQGQEIGHFPEDEVPALVASGEILPSDDYWHEGLDDWRISSHMTLLGPRHCRIWAFSDSLFVVASNHDYLPSICLEEEFGRLDPREILTSTR